MTPEQFRKLRESRNQTRAELGEILGVTAGAIVQWERGTRGIPQWASEKMLKTVNVSLPLEDLSLLLDDASRKGKDFADYLSTIIRGHLAAERAPEELKSMVADESNGTYGAGKPSAASPEKSAAPPAPGTNAPDK